MRIELTDEELDELALLVEARILRKRKKLNERPLTVSEFATASSLSTSQVYRWEKAGKLTKIPNLGKKVLFPASELQKFQG